MQYYSQRKSVDNGTANPAVNKYGTREEMEYQFHLFCASAVKTDIHDLDAVEWGTLELGAIERKVYTRQAGPAQEPVEPESEEPGPETEGEE